MTEENRLLRYLEPEKFQEPEPEPEPIKNISFGSNSGTTSTTLGGSGGAGALHGGTMTHSSSWTSTAANSNLVSSVGVGGYYQTHKVIDIRKYILSESLVLTPAHSQNMIPNMEQQIREGIINKLSTALVSKMLADGEMELTEDRIVDPNTIQPIVRYTLKFK